MSTIWEDLSSLIDSLPPEERKTAYVKLQTWVHDLRGNLGVVYTSIGLLERHSSPEQHEILQLMRENFHPIMASLEEIQRAYKDSE